MSSQNTLQIRTMDGNTLLVKANVPGHNVLLDADVISKISKYRKSALLYQVEKVLEKKEDPTPLEEVFFFADFGDFFNHTDDKRKKQFEKLLKEGFYATWYDPYADANEPPADARRYVPFEKSQSQAKKCVISFIREDLFQPVRERLDLSICFGDMPMPGGLYSDKAYTMSEWSKLYAYRGLYLTEATRLEGEDVRNLLDPDRIIILGEPAAKFEEPESYKCPGEFIRQAREMKIYSKKVGKGYEPNSTVNLDDLPDVLGSVAQAQIDADRIKISSLFDGVGLISPQGAEIFNQALAQALEKKPGKEKAVSFQFRMPFCKGMLHTVDFHRFLKEEVLEKKLRSEWEGTPDEAQIKEQAAQIFEQLEIKDVFGVMRKISQADIILNTSLFKLFKLLNGRPQDKTLIDHYFAKIREYDHSIYLAKTDLQQRYTGYANLTYQILNTLPLTQTDFDRLVQQHLERAKRYDVDKILETRTKLPGIDSEVEGSDRVDKYIKAHPYLVLDDHVKTLIDSCRRQKIDALRQGKLEVEGDMRFLCRDLIYWLLRIAEDCNIEDRVVRHHIGRGQIYLPSVRKKKPQTPVPEVCAVFRSPHLSANENVLSGVAEEDAVHRTYLGHLNRVAFLGTFSHMHSALGGADFDGDMVVVAFQKEVVDACAKKCYREDGQNSLELIDIPSLPAQKSTASLNGTYVDVDTIQNTFSSSIGKISNAAMKIGAAENMLEKLGYAEAMEDAQWKYSAKYCTILNGAEIDAAKNGIRPELKDVTNFALRPQSVIQEAVHRTACKRTDSETARKIVKEVSARATEAMKTVGRYLRINDDLDKEDMAHLKIEEKIREDTKKPYYAITKKLGEYEAEVVSIDISDSEDVPLIYQLLCHWAKARMEDTRITVSEQKRKTSLKMYEELLEDPEQALAAAKKHRYAYPREAILEKMVFPKVRRTAKEVEDLDTVWQAYRKTRQAVSDLSLETSKDRRNSIRKRMLYLLQFKYDDIDKTVDGDLTIRQLSDQIASRLAEEHRQPQELTEKIKELFTSENQLIPWLAMPLEERKHTTVDISAAQEDCRFHQDALSDFYFRGYNVLYFAMQEAACKRREIESRKHFEQDGESAFHTQLLQKTKIWLEEGHTTSRINSRLIPDACREYLEGCGHTDTKRLIRAMYHMEDGKARQLMWDMFLWEDIQDSLGVRKGAE